MSDQPTDKAMGFPGAGQAPEGTPPVEPPVQPSTGPTTISQEQLDQISETVFRRFQGLQDKHAATINKKISDGFKALTQSLEVARASGAQITPEQEAQMKNKIITDAYAEEGTTEPPPPPSPIDQPPTAQGPGQGQEVDQVTLDGWAIMEEKGVFIKQEDPEAELLAKAKTPRQFYAAIEQAIEKKTARLNESGAPPEPPPVLPGAGRMPTNVASSGGHAGDPILNVTDPDQLWQIAREKGKV